MRKTPDDRRQTTDDRLSADGSGLSSFVSRLSSRVRADESGLGILQKIGIAGVLITVLSFIPAARGVLGDFYDSVFKQVDEAGEITSFSIAARGVLIVVVAVVAFLGSALLLLYTNLGRRLAFLIAGAATFGWLVIGGTLFIIYAPRGLRPRNFEGLNAFQFRVPAIAMTMGALVLFLMFILALDKYERESEEQ